MSAIRYVLELTEREAQVLLALTLDAVYWNKVPEAQYMYEALSEAGCKDAFNLKLDSRVGGYPTLSPKTR